MAAVNPRRHAERRSGADARRCRRGVGGGREVRCDPQPLGRRLQAKRFKLSENRRARCAATSRRCVCASCRSSVADLQAFVDRLLDIGHDPSTIRNTLMPVRAIFRRALARGEVAVNATTGLELPAVRGRRDRIASPDEAARLLTALDRDRALWATAMYAGLRLGELLALTWSAVDLDTGLLHVRRSWDPKEGPVASKSRAGLRSVLVPLVLRGHLAEHRLACRWSDGLVFGRSPERPFLAKTPNDRAQRAWRKAELTPIGLRSRLMRTPAPSEFRHRADISPQRR